MAIDISDCLKYAEELVSLTKELADCVSELDQRNFLLETTLVARNKKLAVMKESLSREKLFKEYYRMQLVQMRKTAKGKPTPKSPKEVAKGKK